MTALVDLVIVFLAVEAVLLYVLRRRFPDRYAVLLLGLVAGGFIVLALRSTLAGGAWYWIPVCLVLSWAAHLADRGLRGRRHQRVDQ